MNYLVDSLTYGILLFVFVVGRELIEQRYSHVPLFKIWLFVFVPVLVIAIGISRAFPDFRTDTPFAADMLGIGWGSLLGHLIAARMRERST